MQDDYIKKVGAIVLNPQDLTKVILIYRAKQRDWSFPKGHVEPGEDLFEAAKRELLEETGIGMVVLANLDNLEYQDSRGNNITVFMYLGVADFGNFRPEHDGDYVEWVSLDDIEEKLTYQNLKDYFCQIRKTIKKFKKY